MSKVESVFTHIQCVKPITNDYDCVETISGGENMDINYCLKQESASV
jgi:hypothetical protein